jgi:hypothetical protein
MNWNQAIFPSLKRRGGRAIKENGSVPKQRGPGAKRERFAYYGFALPRSRFASVCGASVASQL